MKLLGYRTHKQPKTLSLSVLDWFFFGQLYDLFSKAPTLGSLINPHRFLGSGLLDEKGMADLHKVLATVLVEESKSVVERYEMGITAQGVAKAAELLGITRPTFYDLMQRHQITDKKTATIEETS